MSAQTDSTRIEIRTRKGVEIMFNVDNSTDKTVKTGVITHRFNQGEGRTHAIGCGAINRESRGTAAVNDRHRNHVEIRMVGFTIEQSAGIIYSDFINEGSMTIAEAVACMGQCKCVKA